MDDRAKIRAALGKPPLESTPPATPAAPVSAPASHAQQGEHIPRKATKPEIVIGSVPVPERLINRNFMFVGMPGSGKSQAILQVLKQVRNRNETVIAIDHGGEFLQRFYRPGKDIIFNPFDARSVGWSPFNEIRRVYDFDRLAKAIVPDIAGENQDWQHGAQQLLANILRALFHRGKAWRNNRALLHYVCFAPQLKSSAVDANGCPVESLQELLQGTSSNRLFEPGNEKGLSITIGIVGRYMQPFTYLSDGHFSITDHVHKFEKGETDSWIFCSYTDSSYEAIKGLFSILIGCAAEASLELSESGTRRFYLVLDEFASLDKIGQIVDFLTKARKRGGVGLLGIQTLAQLEERYGESGAQIIMACLGNWLMLRVPDSKTATMLSDTVGDQEMWETSFNTSTGTSLTTGAQRSASDSENSGSSRQKVIKKAILPSEFRQLPDLTGHFMISGHKVQVAGQVVDVVQVRIPITEMEFVAEREVVAGNVYLSLDDEEPAPVAPAAAPEPVATAPTAAASRFLDD